MRYKQKEAAVLLNIYTLHIKIKKTHNRRCVIKLTKHFGKNKTDIEGLEYERQYCNKTPTNRLQELGKLTAGVKQDASPLLLFCVAEEDERGWALKNC